MTTTFSPKDPAEVIYYGVDFSDILDTSENISSATVSIRTTKGTDAAPSSMLSGAAILDGKTAKHKIIGGVAGCTYQLGFSILTNTGQTFIEGAPLQVIERD